MQLPFVKDRSSASFLPTDYVRSKHEFRANLICLGLFGVVMFGVMGAFFVTNRQWIQIRAQQEQISAEYAREASKVEQLRKLDEQNARMIEKAEVTTALLERVQRRVLLREIVSRMPDRMSLLEVNLEGKRTTAPATQGGMVAGGSNSAAAPATGTLKGRSTVAGRANPIGRPAPSRVEAPRFEYTLRIVGLAEVNNQITDYLRSLQQSPILSEVDLRYIQATDVDKEPFRKFEIRATIRPDADGRDLDVAAAPPQTTPAPKQSAAATTTPREPGDNTPALAAQPQTGTGRGEE